MRVADVAVPVDEVLRRPVLVAVRGSRCRTRCRARPGSGRRAASRLPRTFDGTCSNANSGVCTPTITRPSLWYMRYHASTCGSVRRQLMHEYVQKSISTTLPRSSCMVSGRLFSQPSTPGEVRGRPVVGERRPTRSWRARDRRSRSSPRLKASLPRRSPRCAWKTSVQRDAFARSVSRLKTSAKASAAMTTPKATRKRSIAAAQPLRWRPVRRARSRAGRPRSRACRRLRRGSSSARSRRTRPSS